MCKQTKLKLEMDGIEGTERPVHGLNKPAFDKPGFGETRVWE